MDYVDLLAHLRVCLIADGKEHELEARLHGLEPKKSLSAQDILDRKAKQKYLEGGK
jgi:hypothetical protein